MPEIQTIKISELPETSNLNGLRTLGTTADNQSVAAQLQAVADATANANDAATQAQEAAQTANEAAQTANAAAASANQATDNVIDAINKTEAAYTNATAAAESANEAAAAANSAAEQAIGFINSAQTAVDNANTAANAANEAATTATDAAEQAQQTAQTATDAANNANTQAEYAKEQGDYAKQQGDAVLAQKGQPNGLAELDSTGRVPASQLPSYVDDVIEVDTYDDLPNPGESGKIYITTDNNKQYRWSGTGYAEISPSLALGTTSETAGRGDWTQAAYNHSLITNGSNPHGTTFASLPDAPTSLPANGGNAESAVKDGNGNVIADTYLPLSGGEMTGEITLENGKRITNGGANLISRLIFGNESTLRTVLGAFDYDALLISKSVLKRSTNGIEYTIYDSGNLNPVTIDSDQIITGWKRFIPSTKNGVFNTTGIIDNKDTYATPLSWTAKITGSIWNIQQEADNVTLIGRQGGKAIKFLSHPTVSQVTADYFNGTATQIQDSSNNSSKKIWTGTQEEYDAISTKDSNTIYFIV